MPTQDANLLLVGLPNTGKTTFLIALDETLQNQNDVSGLRSGGLAGNRSYLTSVRKAWLSGEKVERTLRSAEPTELVIEDPGTGLRTTLAVPDMSGEIFEEQWESRSVSDAYKARIAEANGVLLFVSPLGASRNETIDTAWQGMTDAGESAPWQKREAGAQVKVVELVQFMLEPAVAKLPIYIAVLVSAWDIVENSPATLPKGPSKYLEKEWPLLHQFLTSNPEQFSFRVYGVSARGGDDEAQKELLKLHQPAERVKLVEDQCSSKDLTRPLRWILKPQSP